MSHTQVGYALLMFCRCWVVVWTIQQYFVWIIVVICMYVWPDHLFVARRVSCLFILGLSIHPGRGHGHRFSGHL